MGAQVSIMVSSRLLLSFCTVMLYATLPASSSHLHHRPGFLPVCPALVGGSGACRGSVSTAPRVLGWEASSAPSQVVLFAKGKAKRSGGKGGRASKGPNKSRGEGVSSQEAGEGMAPPEGNVMESRATGMAAPAQKGFGAPTSSMSREDFDEVYDKALAKVTGSKAPATERGVVFNPTGPPPPTTMTKTIVRKNINVFTLLPPAVQVGIERVLIGALFVNLVVVIGLGIGFSFQAILTTQFDLPDNVRSLAETVKGLVDKYEQYFTPSIGTFFLTSVFLGSYKIAQLGSEDAVYTEEVPIEEGQQAGGASGSQGAGSSSPPSGPTEINPWKRDLTRSGPL